MDIRNKLSKIIRYFTHDIWQIPLHEFSKLKKLWFKIIRILTITVEESIKGKYTTNASELTYFTLLAIVPILVIAFIVSETLGLKDFLAQKILSIFENQESVANALINFVDNLLSRTKAGLVTIISALIFLWSIITMLSHFETAMNAIWKIPKPRSIWRKITEYFAILILIIAILVITSAATVYVSTQIAENINNETLKELLNIFSGFTSTVLNCLLFAILYVVLPNRKISFKAAAISGSLSGVLFQILYYYYFNIQMSISAFNFIYGSFAALPLLLVWIRLSWIIVLFGAQLSYAIVNEPVYHEERKLD